MRGPDFSTPTPRHTLVSPFKFEAFSYAPVHMWKDCLTVLPSSSLKLLLNSELNTRNFTGKFTDHGSGPGQLYALGRNN